MPLILISNDTSLSMVKLTHTVHNGTSTTSVDMPRVWLPDIVLPGNLVTFRVLEPYAVKVASTVLRRERRGNPPDLSDTIIKLETLFRDAGFTESKNQIKTVRFI